jgi:hypothetical protein
MKVFAIGLADKPVTPEEKKKYMPTEVPATLRLYLDGKMDQYWFHLNQEKPGVVFLLNAESITQAEAIVADLPLAKDGLLKFNFIPVGPLMPLGSLIQGK